MLTYFVVSFALLKGSLSFLICHGGHKYGVSALLHSFIEHSYMKKIFGTVAKLYAVYSALHLPYVTSHVFTYGENFYKSAVNL